MLHRSLRLILLLFGLLIPLTGFAGAVPPGVGERFRALSPFYARTAIPDEPGAITIRFADGSPSLTMGFLGTARLTRMRESPVPTHARFLSVSNTPWSFGIAFYQGTSFSMGLPRTFVIGQGNAFRSEEDAYGAIRVVAWRRGLRYECTTGTIKITRFSDAGREGQFRKWRVIGEFSGTMEMASKRQGQNANVPQSVKISQAAFNCLLLEDRDPIAHSIDLTFSKYYVPTLSLPATGRFDPKDTVQALELRGEELAQRNRFKTHEFSLIIRDAANVSWPPQGEYSFSPQTVDLPDIFLEGNRPVRGLVTWLLYRPQQDLELYYQPVSGSLKFDQSTLMVSNDTTELWRLKGRITGAFQLGDRKIGIGNNGITHLAIDIGLDYEEVRVTAGTFDVLVARPARPSPAWRKHYPNLDPNAPLEFTGL